jgi:hypothetical protein
MILTALLTAICTATFIIGGLILIIVVCHRKVKVIITEFIRPGENNSPSQLSNIVESVSTVFAQRLTMQIKTSLMGMSSVDSRNQRALQGELATGLAVSNNPTLGVLMNLVPSLGKRLTRNPELINLASSLLSGLNNKGNGKSQL